MDNLSVRKSVRILLSHNIGWGRRFRDQNALASFLGVRPATVSGWMNAKSDIPLFTFLRICQAISPDRKNNVGPALNDFIEIFEGRFDYLK